MNSEPVVQMGPCCFCAELFNPLTLILSRHGRNTASLESR